MVIFPLSLDQTIAQMWSNGARARHCGVLSTTSFRRVTPSTVKSIIFTDELTYFRSLWRGSGAEHSRLLNQSVTWLILTKLNTTTERRTTQNT